MPPNQPLTKMLRDFAAGDKSALDQLIPLVYSELHRLARVQLRRERKGHTLQPTALVNEAYARLVGSDQPDYRDRAHFMGVAAQVMRKVLIDHARARNAAKRGGGQVNFSLNEALDAAAEQPTTLIAIDEALQLLERKDPRKARLIELRLFGGLGVDECAEVLQIQSDDARTELRIAQAWLRRQLTRVTPRKK